MRGRVGSGAADAVRGRGEGGDGAGSSGAGGVADGALVVLGTMVAYVVATAVMSVGPGLIRNMQDVAYGAIAVHDWLSAIVLIA